MSSFICGAKHFNSIASNLKDLIKSNDFYVPFSLSTTAPLAYNKTTGLENEIDSFIDTLREVNVLTVSLQYKHHYEGTLNEEIAQQTEIVKEKTAIKKLTPHGLFNALRCLEYQIEINHLTELRQLTAAEENAIKFLYEMISAIAQHIVNKLPDDNTNTWEVN